MKKIILSLLTIIMVLSVAACSKKDATTTQSAVKPTTTKQETMIIPEGYTRVDVEDQVGVNIYGSSVEFDPHFLSQNVRKGISTSEDWELVKERVKKLNVKRFRVMLLPSWIEPFNDNDDVNSINWDTLTLESEEMKSLYAVLDLAMENDIEVNLTLWGVENNLSLLDEDTNFKIKAQGGHFLAKGNQTSNWIMGTLLPEEMAENFAIYVEHLIKNKNYTCIKEITPINEPDYGYIINGERPFEAYKTLCLAIQDRFVKNGIRDLVKFNLSDNIDSDRYWLEDTVETLDSIADMYTSHTYIFGYKTSDSTVEDWEIENMNLTRNTGKPHIVGEFGSNQHVGSSRQSDIDLYERGVLMARLMLDFYNAGASGSSYWVLCDEYYNYSDSYDSMMQLGLFKATKKAYVYDTEYMSGIKEDYETRPQYYAFGLMSNYIEKNTKTYKLETGNSLCAATAFLSEDGKWTYAIANGSEETLKLAITNGNLKADFEVYVYSESTIPTTDDMIESSDTISVENKNLAIAVTGQTVVILRQK